MNFPSIRIEGQIFSGELLQRLDQQDMTGQRPADFGLPSDVKVKDEIARAWADAQDYWRIFQRKLESQKLASTATTETRQQWIVPLLGLLGYQLEYQSRGAELNGKLYAISHRDINRAQTPVHIVGYRDSSGLDRKPENATLRMSPHAMVQEYLNLHDQLYGIVTNGATLRLLRDSFRLVRLNYLEFDLERMFTDGLFADFAVFYRLLHATRLPLSNDVTNASIIELYHQDSIEQGTRIREGLREAVTQALEIFGTGFVSNPDNHAFLDQLVSGNVVPTDFFENLLRLIYRLLFLNVVEERSLVFPEGTSAKHINTYYTHYSVQRLRKLSRSRGMRNDRCHDAWMSLQSTFKIFERPEVAAKLGTTAFGGSLFDSQGLGYLPSCQLDNSCFFRALDCLCSFNDPTTGQRQPINFGALATEEFGSVYESLLELHPIVEITPVARFGFSQAAGNDRKTSGSYYTPSSLVNCLLDSALDPVLEDRIHDYKKLGYATVDAAILSLKVCDPACGSGHFLIAAAQRIARRLAVIRSNGGEPAPSQMRHALREVIGHCIYGVDINPMSVELCRVALWLEAVEPGKPLSFLNHHIQCGNSLLGTTPALLKRGIPDEAFEPIEGDDKKVAAAWKKRNREVKKGQYDLFSDSAAKWSYQNALVAATKDIEAISDDRFLDVERKEAAYADYLASSSFRFGKRICDAWCAAFVQSKIPTAEPITQQVVAQMRIDPNLCPETLAAEIDRLADQYNFFHWQIAFPDVFQPREDDAIRTEDVTGWAGGFDCILGNPPWEIQETKDNEFFAASYPELLSVKSAKDKAEILASIRLQHTRLWSDYEQYLRQGEGQRHLLSNGGFFPFSGSGRMNLYRLFLEWGQHALNATGLVGIIMPSGFASDSYSQKHFAYLHRTGRLINLFDFENREGLFPSVDSRFRFCLLTLGPERQNAITDFVFFATDTSDIRRPDKRISLSASDLEEINPLTSTAPVFRSQKDFVLTRRLQKSGPLLAESTPSQWQIKPVLMFMMNAAMKGHKSAEELESVGFRAHGNRYESSSECWLPFYEGKMVGMYDHRAASIRFDPSNRVRRNQPIDFTKEEHASASTYALPMFWVKTSDVSDRCGGLPSWCLAVKDVTSSTNERTSIAAILPGVALSDSLPWLRCDRGAVQNAALLSILNSMVFDYVARQKVAGLHLRGHYLAQLPLLPFSFCDEACIWAIDTINQRWLLSRVIELSFTAWDLEPFANDCGYDGPPFKWDEERRFLLRCELDGAFFHLYLGSEDNWRKNGTVELLAAFPTPRDAVVYIMDTFPIVKRKDEAAHGTYRTKDTILSIYDAMQTSIRTGQPYQTLLGPPPGPPVEDSGNFIPITQWDEENWPTHIHPPKKDKINFKDEFKIDVFAPLSYPETEAERAICAAALAIIEQLGTLSSQEHLDALLLATHPEWCKVFLAPADQNTYTQTLKKSPSTLFVEENESIRWKECIGYLELRKGIAIDHSSINQEIKIGTEIRTVKNDLPSGIDGVLKYAISALQRIVELRRDMTQATVSQQSIMNILQHYKKQQLVA